MDFEILLKNSPSEWIIAISSIITAVFSITTAILAFIAVFSYKLSLQGLKADHERSRREKGVDLLIEWSKLLDEKKSLTRKFAELLSLEQLRSINNQEKFYINKHPDRLIKLLNACLDTNLEEKKDEKNKNCPILISEENSSKIRWQLVTYLNLLESIISAWANEVADKELIENQFSYLFSNDYSSNGLKTFRELNGGAAAFPSLELFELEMKKKNEKELIKKSPLMKNEKQQT